MSIYVKMKDCFFSGWGRSEGKVNLYVIECDTQAQAKQIKRAAGQRGEMTQVKILGHCPKGSHHVLVTCEHFNDLGSIWTGSEA